MTKTVLVLGASGGIGGEMVRTLNSYGWRVRAFNRTREEMDDQGVQWIKGDALKRADVLKAASGVDVIVHAVNPPGYRDWETLSLPMLNSTLSAARAVGATIVLPGTIYNFGPDVLPVLHEDAPQNPVTKKGKIRVAMEAQLEAFAREGGPKGAKVIIVRAGDFFGPNAGNNWFSQVVTAGKQVRQITRIANKGLGHQWAYLPDVAETMVRLMERRDTLPPFARYHFKGHWDANGEEMAAAIRHVTGNPRLKLKPFAWKMVKYLSPFVLLFRELREMRYLWKMAVFMDNQALVEVLGEEPHTPWNEAIKTTLIGQGCLEG
jgi:nucleoside-diphosphate-sugar epimerase